MDKLKYNMINTLMQITQKMNMNMFSVLPIIKQIYMPIGRPTKYNEKTIIEMYEKYNFKL